MIDINSVTYEDLKAGKYEKELPELYELKKAVEHNLPFHNRQIVFDHVLEVFKNTKELLKLDFVDDEERRTKIEGHLKGRIGNFTRKELLLQSAILHDIAKGVTLEELPDGRSVCPKHDIVGAEMVGKFKDRFGWSEEDMEFIKSLVKNHLDLADLIDVAWKEPEKREEAYIKIKEMTGDACLEETLLVWADTLGLHLAEHNPSYLKSRDKICRELVLNEIEI